MNHAHSPRFFRLPGRRQSHPKSPGSGIKTAESSPDNKSGGATSDLHEEASSGRTATLEQPLKSTCTDESKTHKKKHRHVPGGKVFKRFTHSVGHHVHSLGHHLDEIFFPKFKPSDTHRIRVNNGVLLNGCDSEEDHERMVGAFLNLVEDMKGEEGLRAAGFHYASVHCDDHNGASEDNGGAGDDSDDELISLMEDAVIINASEHDALKENIDSSLKAENAPKKHEAATRICSHSMHDGPPCSQCTTRLFHAESQSLITEDNRRRYIADGEMYEEVARLCQEYAQQLMQREGHLEWMTICDDESSGEPVRALIHVDHHVSTGASTRSGASSSQDGEDTEDDDAEPRPTLLIATGKGKVRAGIFSRHHLMVSGIEPSTAVPMVREATRRNMNITILDPNARGDRVGMVTFEKSIGALFGHWEEAEAGSHCSRPHELYVLAHSQSGSQLVQYLLARAEYYLPRIRAIAFTDSTHNIQWTKQNADVRNLLESSACVYVRSSNVKRDSNWQDHEAGDIVETDKFWQHRFGSIRTMWAGTKEHSLTNWTAHSHIWDHFDRHLHTGTYVSTFAVTDVSGHEQEDAGEEKECKEQVEESTRSEPESRGVPVGIVTV